MSSLTVRKTQALVNHDKIITRFIATDGCYRGYGDTEDEAIRRCNVQRSISLANM